MSRTSDPREPARPGDRPGARPPTGPPTGRRRTLAVAAGALVALLLVVWALTQRDDDRAPVTADDAEPTVTSSATPEPSATPSSTPSATPGVVPAPAPAPGPAAPDPATPEQPALPPPLTPRALTEEAEIGPEAVARVSRLEAVEGEPQGVGEIGGPALRFTIELQNTGTGPIRVQDAVVNVTYGDEATPATEVSGPGRQPFVGDVAPGATATGTYVFVVPTEQRGAVSVSLEYRAGAPVAVFQGSAAAAPAG
ncbi:DUF4352 domain-containing protein [Cellulomonas aerilata]|uniref:DUF4352 domain-containing protein n=1 Tax=Cellulomonas aerilata TaxID=515326 RepID=A0A512DEI6_9CELL|nr:DUF4352 domain-containing protein [Cellulomonas aerilata]GEO34640.1 hypothetical protein CAE01nite_23650 [Cellulomonas aerilata]